MAQRIASLPDFILVGHASGVVHAAKNTIRMAALTGRIKHKQSPWGLVVSTQGCAELYPLRDGFERHNGKVLYSFNSDSGDASND